MPPKATQNKIIDLQDFDKTALEQFKTCNLVERTARNSAVSPIEDTCVNTLEDECPGYNNATMCKLFCHLHGYYSIISNQDLTKNEESIKEKLDASTTIKHYSN